MKLSHEDATKQALDVANQTVSILVKQTATLTGRGVHVILMIAVEPDENTQTIFATATTVDEASLPAIFAEYAIKSAK